MEHHHSALWAPVNALWRRLGFNFEFPDHVIMALLVLLISSTLFPFIARRISRDNPGGFQQFLEFIVGGLRGLVEEIIGHGSSRKYLNTVAAFAVFIFISNILGLFYFLQPPTGSVNTTFALALCSFIYFNYQGIKTQGIVHYMKHFMGPIPALAILMFPIEIIGNFARILSLGMRLFGNITGEHTATGIFMGMMPLIVPWPMMALGIFGATLQTFVFTLLTMVYIGGAVASEEH
jgi:F-type H+-transporting ATPase subunit a